MTLIQAVESYIVLKRSLGAVFAADARILRSFARTLGDVPVESIGMPACQSFCRGTGPPTRFWERKDQALRGFFRYLVHRGLLAKSPLPPSAPRLPRSFQAYIYSHAQLRQLLDATSLLKTPDFPRQALVFRTLLLLLYGAGLRPSEAIRLRCCDLELRARTISVWDTKFFKSRLVPLGPDLCSALAAYRKARLRLPLPQMAQSALFCTRLGLRISLARLEKIFVCLREHAGIRRPASERWQPRLHDLRHTFAVHRLICWYREGADLQACLPLLATYLGHINLSGTQTYLTMTAELLELASRRFERYAAPGKEMHHAGETPDGSLDSAFPAGGSPRL
jgi:site-specific recombinase XerD